MRVPRQQVGNSVEFEREVDIDEDGTIVRRKPKYLPREGWAEASRALAASGDDALVWPEFANEGDAELIW